MVVASAPITFEEIGVIYNIIVSFFPIGYYQGKKMRTPRNQESQGRKKKNTTSTKVRQLAFFD